MSDIHVFYVSAGLLAPQHHNRIGESLWEFLWLVSHETRMEGKVLNGSPITLGRIAQELGESPRTARRNLERLSKAGYVKKQRTGPGHMYCYSITHSKKWRQFVAEDTNGRSSTVELRTKVAAGPAISGRTNKEVDRVDSTYISSTICKKCKGCGYYLELIPSGLNPDGHVEKWVKCDECQ